MDIKAILSLFGLNDKEKEIFLLLAKSDWSTVLSLSRKCEIKRTSIYRILESLNQKGLVDINIDDNTSYYHLANIHGFNILLEKEKERLTKLQTSLQDLTSLLPMLSPQNSDSTSVRFYRGKKGIETAEWQTASILNTETLIFSTEKWSQITGVAFAETIRAKRVQNHAVVKELLNPDVFTIIPKTAKVTWTKNQEYLKKIYSHRQISKTLVPITNEILIFQNSLFIYSFTGEDVIVIEIISEGCARLLKSLFYLVWRQAEIKDNFGKDK